MSSFTSLMLFIRLRQVWRKNRLFVVSKVSLTLRQKKTFFLFQWSSLRTGYHSPPLTLGVYIFFIHFFLIWNKSDFWLSGSGVLTLPPPFSTLFSDSTTKITTYFFGVYSLSHFFLVECRLLTVNGLDFREKNVLVLQTYYENLKVFLLGPYLNPESIWIFHTSSLFIKNL